MSRPLKTSNIWLHAFLKLCKIRNDDVREEKMSANLAGNYFWSKLLALVQRVASLTVGLFILTIAF